VVVQFRIEADGSVRESFIEASELPERARGVADCIVETSKGWHFPPPEGGGLVIVSYPFVLEPSEETASRSGN
jgi:hypothetical protein